MRQAGLHNLSIYTVLLISIVVSSPLNALAEDDKRSESRFYYTGTIGDDLPVQMELVIDSPDVTGTYMYDKVGIPIALTGEVDTASSVITLTEQDEKGGRTGTFKGKIISEGTNFGKIIEGTWHKAKGGGEIPFKLGKVAFYVSSELKADGSYEMTYMVPRFISGSEPIAEITEALEKRALEEQAKFIKEAEEYFSGGDSAGQWQENYSYSIEYYSPGLISLSGEVFSYTGGAHGNTYYMSSNYRIRDGKAQLIGLADLFKPGTGYMKTISDYCIEDLGKQQAGWVLNGELKELKTEDLGAFVISPGGIKFAFAPYAAGPYVEGSYFVLVPYSALGGSINTKGPLSAFVKSVSATDEN